MGTMYPQIRNINNLVCYDKMQLFQNIFSDVRWLIIGSYWEKSL